EGPYSCPIDGFDFNAVSRLIKLPGNHVLVLMVSVVQKAVGTWPRSGKLPREELVIRYRF
ncbi:nitroreductase family protein, partial [Pseudomonas aeruginosa]